MNIRTTVVLTATAALALAAVPASASARPEDPATPGPRNVVNGPDIGAGARNAPGSQAITELINILGAYVIFACLICLLLSGLILAIGPRLGFTQASTIGKVGVFVALGVAFLVGIAATLINFSYNAGA